MNVLNLLKKYVIDSQMYVALMGSLLAAFFMVEQNAFRFPTFFLILITYFCGYLYTKFQNTRFLWKVLAINSVLGVFCAVMIIHNHHTERLYKWLIICLLGFLYNSSFLENYIRKIPLFKVFYVGLVWGLVNAWLSFSVFNFPIFLISFLFVTALVLPFDIRDMKDDDIVTFPKIIGEQNTKYLAYIMVFLACVLASYFLPVVYSAAFCLTSLVTFIFIYFSEQNNTESYFSFGVESCSGLPFLFLILLKYF